MTARRAARLIAATIVASVAVTAARAQEPLTRTFYATVTEDDGRPVVDLSASELEVREDGRPQQITLRPATAPLRVALIVSDRGGGQFQLGALRFAEALLGHGEISITGVVVQPETLTDYTSRADQLRDGLLRLGRRAASAGDNSAQLVEAILDVARNIRREGWRPAIVVMRSGGEALTSIPAARVRDAIRESGAVFYAISTIRSDGRSWPDGGGESRLTLPSILGDGTDESGGRYIEVVVNTMVPTMQQVALELVNQYEISYTLPAGSRADGRLSVDVTRPGVRVFAPRRLAP